MKAVNLKSLILGSLMVAPIVSQAAGPIASGGAVSVEAKCVTANQMLEVLVLKNGANYTAAIHDGNRVELARYKAEPYRGMQSASFGRAKYLDIANQGSEFLLQGPSTNFRHYSVKVTLANGAVIADDDLTCVIFGGRILPGN